MKTILLAVIFVTFTSIAIINLRHYKLRLKTVQELIVFFRKYINEVTCFKSDYESICLSLIDVLSLPTKQMLADRLNIDKYPQIFSHLECKEFYNILSSLGKHDVEGEEQMTKNAILLLEDKAKMYEADLRDKGLLRKKLIFIFGLIVLLIIL